MKCSPPILCPQLRGTKDLKINNTRPLLSGNLQVRGGDQHTAHFSKGRILENFCNMCLE